MAKKAATQKLTSIWSTVTGGDQSLSVDFRPLPAPVALRVQHAKQAAATAKARIIRVDCYLG